MPRAIVSRRTALAHLATWAALPLVAACQATAAGPTPVANPLIKPTARAGVPLTVVLASSELALGRNRLALGLIDERNQAITSGTVALELFKVEPQASKAQKRAETIATFRAVENLAKGTWVSAASFDETGPWGAQVTVQRPDQPSLSARVAFEVKPAFSAPGYGAPVPRSTTPSLRDTNGDASRLCSASPPCDMHELSIAEALQDGTRPLVVLFATPAFCTSATCAPELSAVQSLRDSGNADRANFIHVEIYQYPFTEMKPAPSVLEWNLPSEPWVFVVARDGTVSDRFEGSAPVDELRPALQAAL